MNTEIKKTKVNLYETAKNQERSSQIINEYHEKIKQNPENEIYHYLMGQILEETEDKIKEHQKAIEINPDYYLATPKFRQLPLDKG